MGGINSINQFNDPIVTPVNTCMGIQDKKQENHLNFEELLYENIRRNNQRQEQIKKEDEKKSEEKQTQIDPTKLLNYQFALMNSLIKSSSEKKDERKNK